MPRNAFQRGNKVLNKMFLRYDAVGNKFMILLDIYLWKYYVYKKPATSKLFRRLLIVQWRNTTHNQTLHTSSKWLSGFPDSFEVRLQTISLLSFFHNFLALLTCGSEKNEICHMLRVTVHVKRLKTSQRLFVIIRCDLNIVFWGQWHLRLYEWCNIVTHTIILKDLGCALIILTN